MTYFMRFFMLTPMLLLFGFFSNAQTTLDFDPNTSFFPINENSFISYSQKADHYTFKKWNAAGDLLWENDLYMDGYSDSFNIQEILFYPNTDSLLVLSTVSLRVRVNPSQHINDTILCQFTRLNNYSGVLENHFVDTIYSPGRLFLNPYNSDSILFINSYKGEVFNSMITKFQTRSIDYDLNLNILASPDSIVESNGWNGYQFFTFNDSLYFLAHIDGAELLTAYDQNFSSFFEGWADRNPGQMHSNKILNFTVLSKDSIFIFKKGSFSNDIKWMFLWSDYELSTLRVRHISAPWLNATTQYQFTNYSKILFDKSKNEIYIFARANSSTKMFVYDNDFELKCEFTISGIVYDNCQLISVLDKVYIKQCNAVGCKLIQVNTCESLNVIDNSPNLIDVLVYPNPFSNMLKIELNSNFENGSVVLIDNLGREIETFELKQSFQIDLSHLDAATYWLRFENEYNTFTKKIIKVQ
jgi:hypothetical protein